MRAVIFIYGDSIAYGAADLEMGGWAHRLRLYFNNRTTAGDDVDIRLCNLSIPGETTAGLVERISSEIPPRLRDDCENIFIFAYGMNDFAFPPEGTKPLVELEYFSENLQSALAIAREYSQKIYVLNITPVLDEIAGAQRAGRRIRFCRNMTPYNARLKEFSAANGCTLIDVNKDFIEQNYALLLTEDGVHPNAAGHKVIFERVRKDLEEGEARVL